jgi:N6-adenosine-specific RNA methylase IME4
MIEIPNKEYQVVYADPPWRYDFSKSDSRQIENRYPTMDIEEIKKLQVPTAPNAVLYLWATSPKLPEALSVMSAWGFTYKSKGIWDKQIPGCGYWWRGQTEDLLVGTKGKFSPPIPSLRISSLYSEKRTQHSKKPNYFRNQITKWYPNQLKIELFSRGYYDGWDVWGNEVIYLMMMFFRIYLITKTTKVKYKVCSLG